MVRVIKKIRRILRRNQHVKVRSLRRKDRSAPLPSVKVQRWAEQVERTAYDEGDLKI
jgi:hypothetical protein